MTDKHLLSEIVAGLDGAQKALQPFSDAVFNDNGDMTVDMSFAKYDDFVRAYFAAKKLSGLSDRIAAYVEQLEKALGEFDCPRPCNGRPDDLTVAQCVGAGECGCGARAALGGSNE